MNQVQVEPTNQNQEKQDSDNQQITGQKVHKRKRRLAIIFWVIVFLILMAILVIAPTLRGNIKNSLPLFPRLDRNITGSMTQKEDLQGSDLSEAAILQQEVINNTLNARIASAIQPDKNGRMYLSLRNKYEDKLLQVTIVNEETQEIYYTSPVLDPRMEIEYDQITQQPTAGEYSCIAYFYYYTMNDEPISQVGAKIKLIIE